jgi:hypothetical protein
MVVVLGPPDPNDLFFVSVVVVPAPVPFAEHPASLRSTLSAVQLVGFQLIGMEQFASSSVHCVLPFLLLEPSHFLCSSLGCQLN